MMNGTSTLDLEVFTKGVLHRERDDYDTALGAFTWDLPEEAHSDMFVGDMANWWLDNYPVDGPLFLEIGFPGPHPPYDPTSEYLGKYINKDLPLLEVTEEEEMAGLPPGLAGMRIHNTEVDHDSIKYTLSQPKRCVTVSGSLSSKCNND